MPKAWTVPTLTGLNNYLKQDDLVQMNETEILADDQSQEPLLPDRFTALVYEVTDAIRQKIQSIPGFVVSATALSVPPEMLGLAYGRIASRLHNAFPLKVEVNEKIVKYWQDQWDTFVESEKLNEFGVSMPPDPMTSDVQRKNAPAQVLSREDYCRRVVTVKTMAGI